MNRQDRNIEDLFRTLFEQFTVNPTSGLWKKIQAKIAWKQFLSFSFNSFNIYYLALIIALAATGAYLMLPRENLQQITEKSAIITSFHVSQSEPVPDQLNTPEDPVAKVVKAPANAWATPATMPAPEKTMRTTRLQKSPVKTLSKPISAVQEPVYQTKETSRAEALPIENGSGTEPGNIRVRIEFSANPLSGCSPLAVNFQNLSEHVTGIDWNFGDGGNSDEFNPSYVFDEPGEFVVTLKVQGKDGLAYSRQQTIRVFETPKALFEFDEDVKPTHHQPVYFYNYSRGGDYYMWDFGDNQQSELRDPIYFYEGTGNFHVKLTVWTEDQCYDSMVVFNAFTTQEQQIKVPNAFTPNLNGPTGGYYDVNDYTNSVFHPVINGELVEFQLKVFSRKGVLLFESKDISLGWDGYYNEQLMNQDVYIWKIRGKFDNGKTFLESGDVTLIKQIGSAAQSY